MRVAISLVLIIAGLGVVGVAFAGTDELRRPRQKLALAPIESRGWPAGMGAAKPAEAAAAPAETRPPETKPAETKPAETKPAETKAPAAAARPAEAKPAETKPAAAAGTPPAEARPAAAAGTATRPGAAPVAGKPAEPGAAPAPAAANDAMLNLRASDTADVFIDGKKVGTSPVLGFKVKPGKHKIRFDCYEASGTTTKGPEVVMDVRANEEKDKEYECTAEAKAPSHEESPY
jgi:hypothetical protein